MTKPDETEAAVRFSDELLEREATHVYLKLPVKCLS